MAKRAAIIDDLLRKGGKRKTEEFINEDGDTLTMTFKALPARVYDDLLAEHPPTKKQKDDGANHNIDTFAPVLISRCLVEPELTVEQATEIWTSPDWSRGERMDIYMAAVRVNVAGFDVPTNAPV